MLYISESDMLHEIIMLLNDKNYKDKEEEQC